jgi:hypothetical protein
MGMTMNQQLTRLISTLLITLIAISTTGFAMADERINGSDILNTDFGAHIGIVSDINAQGQHGIFIYRTFDEAPLLSMLAEDIEAAAFEYTGHYLVAYDASGQALYEFIKCKSLRLMVRLT